MARRPAHAIFNNAVSPEADALVGIAASGGTPYLQLALCVMLVRLVR